MLRICYILLAKVVCKLVRAAIVVVRFCICRQLIARVFGEL